MNTISPTPNPEISKNKALKELSNQLKELNFPDHEPLAREIYEYAGCESSEIDRILVRLRASEPWEYICNKKMFHGHPFYVDNPVLIPRVETETLVDRAISNILNVAPVSKNHSTLHVVDIGCGSGCIGISTLLGVDSRAVNDLEESNIRFTFTDVSGGALEICNRNVKKLLTKKQIRAVKLIKSDLLKNINFNNEEGLIFLANLPYVKEDDLKRIDPSVANWEPTEALVGGGEDGLNTIRRFLNQASALPNRHTIYLEMDPSQIHILKKELPSTYQKVEEFKDNYGLVRFLRLETSD